MRQRYAAPAVATGATWLESARAIREAVAAGMSLSSLAEETGIAEAVLHRWRVALEVCETLDQTALGEAAHARLGADGSDEILYALRRLPQDLRTAAARYALERHLSAAMAERLVEAINECRRSGTADGFTCAPGDALAFRRWVQAKISTSPAERERYLREGLALAETEAAREWFRIALSQLSADTHAVLPQGRAAVPIRWVGQAHARPCLIPYLADLAELGRPVPTAPLRLEGPSWTWWEAPAGRYVALPGWPEVAGLVRPVAVPCHAALLPVAGIAQLPPDAPVLAVVETAGDEPAPGQVWLQRRQEAVVTLVVGPDGLPGSEDLLGRVTLVVGLASPGAPGGDDDGEADLDCWG